MGAQRDGTVSFDTSIDMYRGRLPRMKHPVTGKTVRPAVTARTKGACWEKLKDKRAEMDALTAKCKLAPADRTIAQCVKDWLAWLPSQPGIGPATVAKYTRQAAWWIYPDPKNPGTRDRDVVKYCATFGATPLSDVGVPVLTGWIETAAPFLGADALRDLLGIVRRSVDREMAVNDKVQFNPACNVRLPEAGHKPADADFLDLAEVEAVLAHATGPLRVLLMTGFFLGLRPGEIRALKWDHVVLDKVLLYVLEYARSEGDGDTKTGSSRRALGIAARLVAALRRLHADELAAGRGKPGDYVFTDTDGGQWTGPALARAVARVAKAAIGRAIRPYAMRHTFATLMDAAGVKHRRIADMMGHASLITFYAVYRHRLRPEDPGTAGIVDDVFGTEDPGPGTSGVVVEMPVHEHVPVHGEVPAEVA